MVSPASVQALIHAQKNIEEEIRRLRKRLKEIEEVPGTQPWIPMKTVTEVSQLVARHPTLKDVLKHDLEILKSQLKETRAAARTESLNLAKAQARGRREDFERRAKEILEDAAKTGRLDAGKLQGLLDESNRIVEDHLKIVDRDPSPKTVADTLGVLGTNLKLGGDPEEPFRRLGQAGAKLHDRAVKQFRGNPSVGNFKRTLKTDELRQRLGADEGTQASPPKIREGDRHTVAAGETLASIAELWYGHAHHWGEIYKANPKEIGPDPAKLPAGTELRIP